MLEAYAFPGAAPPGGVRGTTYPPLLWYVPRRGYNAIYVVTCGVLQATVFKILMLMLK